MKQETWRIERDGQIYKYWDFARIMAGDVIIAQVQASEGPEKRGAERLALMATAPALLEALKECVDRLAIFYEEGREHPAIVAADAAIRAAKGGES